jgi:hypothetical protein
VKGKRENRYVIKVMRLNKEGVAVEGVYENFASKMKRRFFFETKKPVSSPLT